MAGLQGQDFRLDVPGPDVTAMPVEGAWFSAIPAPVSGTGTFPVRAVAAIPV